jgi:hypothetical protein
VWRQVAEDGTKLWTDRTKTGRKCKRCWKIRYWYAHKPCTQAGERERERQRDRPLGSPRNKQIWGRKNTFSRFPKLFEPQFWTMSFLPFVIFCILYWPWSSFIKITDPFLSCWPWGPECIPFSTAPALDLGFESQSGFECMSAFVLFLCCPMWVQGSWRANIPPKVSYQISVKKIRNTGKREASTTLVCSVTYVNTTIDIYRINECFSKGRRS